MSEKKYDLEILRHSCAHIMAAAVKKLYPQAKFAIGPSIESGFYYDFDIPGGITEEDLPKIEQLMKKEIKQKIPFVKEEWGSDEAIEYFEAKGETYKVELIKDLNTEKVSIYKQGDFLDLCRGPHVETTGDLRHIKLLSTSGAYWRGIGTNPQLVRIYGTAFPTKDELIKYVTFLEEAKKRDHRTVGRQQRLFDIYHNQAGAGLVFFLPRGAILRRIIEDWEIKEHIKRGYQVVNTPHIMDSKLWEKSGHLEHYADYMYPVIKDNQEFILKPMNCPGHILIYKSQVHGYRDLPLRMFELGTVYRYEKSGVLHGLLRVRGFTQDDAHIFCRPDDLESEIEGVLDFVSDAMNKFGFKNFDAELSTRPEKYIGQKEIWDLSEKALESVLKKKNFNYRVNAGDGAFYGPKIDIKLKDALGRQWQCATVQLDYNVPERFDVTYRDSDGCDKRVIMLHRVILGSLERFIATLIEHYAGKFPLWLAPVQVSIITISEEINDYAKSVREKLEQEGFRAEVDLRDERMQKKIKEKEFFKIPYMLILGKNEMEENKVSVRMRGMKNLGVKTFNEFILDLKTELNSKE